MGNIRINSSLKMIKLSIITLLNILYGQDSLFWFDMNTVKDPIPQSPKVLDEIFGISQLNILDSLGNMRKKSRTGYRLQIYESSSVDEANRKLKKYKKVLPDSIYLIFEAPLYKIRYGNFIDKNIAEDVKTQLQKKGYKNIWIVRSRILYDSLKKEKIF